MALSPSLLTNFGRRRVRPGHSSPPIKAVYSICQERVLDNTDSYTRQAASLAILKASGKRTSVMDGFAREDINVTANLKAMVVCE
jgi:hypothetical protein